MKTITPTTHALLEMQGFSGMDDAALAGLRPWLRVAPALTIVWVAVGLLLGSARVIWAVLPFSLLGAMLPHHPFDVFFNFGIRFFTRTHTLPGYHFGKPAACSTGKTASRAYGFASTTTRETLLWKPLNG